MSDTTSGHWVTLHGGDGDGTHVFLGGDGKIEKGPAALAGKKIHELKAAGHHDSETHHHDKTDAAKPPPQESPPEAPSGHITNLSFVKDHMARMGPIEKTMVGHAMRALDHVHANVEGVSDAQTNYAKNVIVGAARPMMVDIGTAARRVVDTPENRMAADEQGQKIAELIKSKKSARFFLDNKRFDGGIPLSAFAQKDLSASWLGQPIDARDFSQATGDGLSYWKDVLTLGNYVDPKDGKPFAITPGLYSAIEASFAQMQAIGDEPPIVKDHKETADSTLGYIKALRRNGDKLQALHKFSDAGARDIALRNKVSVRVRPDVQLSNGHRAGLCLTHVAITPRPVLTHGMNDWDLALSRGSEGDVPETYFAAPAPTKELNMTAEQLERAKKIVPTATDENAIDVLLSFAETETKNSETTALELSQVKAERDDLLKAKPLELSQADVSLRKRLAKAEIGVITAKYPQVAKDAVNAYLDKGKRAGLMLSATEGDRTELDDFADLLKAIPLKGLLAHDKETTAGQGLTLSRDVPDGDNADQPVSDARRKELMAQSGMNV